MANKMVTEYHISNKVVWGKGGARSAKLVMLIDFKSHKDMGEVSLAYNGKSKRIICDTFSEAQTMYQAAMEWIDGEDNEDMFYWDGEEEESEDENQ